tara:strand:- start:22669 stop:23205 length:537 start_codon:yes stop_codon:yes gene_type:complete
MKITKFIFHRLLGWKLRGSFDPAIKKSVVIVVPHTSWHDFYVGAFSRRILQTEIHFIAKKELFKGVMGAYLRWMGGAPLDRTPGQKKTAAIANLFEEREEFRLALAPEGTRKKVDAWKTGYYYIALAAEVPIIPVAFDYRTKTVSIHPAFYPTGNVTKDTVGLKKYYKDVEGKIPEYT